MNKAFFSNIFWGSNNGDMSFSLFSKSHVISLIVIFSAIIIMKFKKNELQLPSVRKKIGWTLSIILFIQQFLLYYWYVDSNNFTLKESLPLYTCRIAILLSIIMNIKGSFGIFELVYFWGLGGSIIALMTPDTGGFQFPHWMFLQFFIGHGGLIISVFFTMIAYNYRPTLHSLRKTIKCCFIYLFTVGGLNYLVDGNYSYLRAKPQTATFLDYFPPYPYYVPFLVAIMIAFFSLLYLPYYIKDIKETDTDDIYL